MGYILYRNKKYYSDVRIRFVKHKYTNRYKGKNQVKVYQYIYFYFSREFIKKNKWEVGDKINFYYNEEDKYKFLLKKSIGNHGFTLCNVKERTDVRIVFRFNLFGSEFKGTIEPKFEMCDEGLKIYLEERIDYD